MFWLLVATSAVVVPCCARPDARRGTFSQAVDNLAQVTPVAIVAWPSPLRPKCQIRDLPEHVNVQVFAVEDADNGPLRRYFVNGRQIEAKLDEDRELRLVVQDLLTCVRMLTQDGGSP